MIGVNCTKSTVAVVRAGVDEDNELKIFDSRTVDFSAENGASLIQLRECLRQLIQQWTSSNYGKRLAILKCSDGRMSASSSAFKAEGVVQIVAEELEVETILVTPQSLARGLGCDQGEKWQDRAKDLMNSDGSIKHWTAKGINGAAAAAYKAIKH